MPAPKHSAAILRFLELLSQGASISRAAREAGLSRTFLYGLRRKDSAFAHAWNDAREAAQDQLEDAARARALEGSERMLALLLSERQSSRKSPASPAAPGRVVHLPEIPATIEEWLRKYGPNRADPDKGEDH